MNHIGIDVSGKELSVVVSVNGKHRKAQRYENTPEDHKRLIALIQELQDESIVCMEATGMHHFDLAVALSRAEKITVTVINPKAAHNFAKALVQRCKTDSIDADVLASYAERLSNSNTLVKKCWHYVLWRAAFPRPTKSKRR